MVWNSSIYLEMDLSSDSYLLVNNSAARLIILGSVRPLLNLPGLFCRSHNSQAIKPPEPSQSG